MLTVATQQFAVILLGKFNQRDNKVPVFITLQYKRPAQVQIGKIEPDGSCSFGVVRFNFSIGAYGFFKPPKLLQAVSCSETAPG